MREKSESIFYNVDWVTVIIYVALVAMGWFNIYSAVYDPEKSSIFDFSRQESKQLIFIAFSFILAFAILVIDASFFTATAYLLYGGIILLNIAVRFLGTEIKGSHSWFKFGSVSLQPAEFAKWATLLAIAKLMSGINKNASGSEGVFNAMARSSGSWLNRTLSKYFSKEFLATVGLILLPIVIMIVLQNETGVALVFTAFIFVLYREGVFPGGILLFGMAAAATVIIGIKYPGTIVQLDKNYEKIIAYHFNFVNILIFAGILVFAGIIRLLIVRRTIAQIILTVLTIGIFTGVYVAAPLVLEKMPSHMKGRIKCWLGLPVPPEIDAKYGWNTKQSMIAIGSGGWTGKGYLQGTQTKFRFVPEQETDFIFCTVGEEWGFLGTAFVIVLYLVLIMRLIIRSERQRSDFTRVYGYGVASVFFIHLIVNVGMTIGLLPVIGIPLPFFSYGGSSLISFTILLFIFIKLDSQRLLVLR